MAGRAVWRSGGLVVGFVAGAMVARGVSFLSARPPDRPSADIHAEYVKYASGKDSIAAYVAYPARVAAAPAVVVIHEIFGMSDFVRATTEQLAKQGFVALAPDLLSRRGGTPASADSARRLIASLDPDTITQDLDAAVAYLKTLKAVRPEQIGVIGFCWGGGQSFRYATTNPALGAFVVCYGPMPRGGAADIARIKAPGLGVYADRDARITGDIPTVAMAARQGGVDYRFKVYRDVGHGFLRTREKPAVAEEAWSDVIAFLHAHLGH
jgi:carboxymethylenebutenolidase